MGTRATVKFYNEEPKENSIPLVNFYYQYDGDYDVIGKQLADWLKSKSVINGIQHQTMADGFANGVSCLAAQFCKGKKNKIGHFYINTLTNVEYYDYKVWVDFNTNVIYMSIHEFIGEPKEFDAFIKLEIDKED